MIFYGKKHNQKLYIQHITFKEIHFEHDKVHLLTCIIINHVFPLIFGLFYFNYGMQIIIYSMGILFIRIRPAIMKEYINNA